MLKLIYVEWRSVRARRWWIDRQGVLHFNGQRGWERRNSIWIWWDQDDDELMILLLKILMTMIMMMLMMRTSLLFFFLYILCLVYAACVSISPCIWSSSWWFLVASRCCAGLWTCTIRLWWDDVGGMRARNIWSFVKHMVHRWVMVHAFYILELYRISNIMLVW